MDFDSLFSLGDSEALENMYDTGQYEGIDWPSATAAHLESPLGLETPRDKTLLDPADEALTMMNYQVQLKGGSNMFDADFSFENQATSTDWNKFNASRIQDLDLPAADSLSGLTNEEKYSNHTEPGSQTREPSMAVIHYFDENVQFSDDSNMLDADLDFENKATSTDWNKPNPSRIEDLDLPAVESLSGLTDQEKRSSAGQHAAQSELGPQAREPSVGAIHHPDGTETFSMKNASPEDWTKHRGLITCLYDKMTLPELMRHMKQKKGFSATTKMYKSRFTIWGLDSKNNREKDMRAAVRKRNQRTQQGKCTNFRIRDKPVDCQEIVRYFARKGLSIEDVVALRSASKTPDAVVCLTPITSPIAIPEVYNIPQLLFTTIRDYVDGSFRSRLWIKTKPTHLCRSTRGNRNYIGRLVGQCYEVSDLLELGHLRAANIVLDSAVGSIHHMLFEGDPLILARLFELSAKLFHTGRYEIALAIIRAMAEIGASTLGQQHPLPRIAGFLLRLDGSDIAEVGAKYLQAFGDQFEDVLGPMHWSSLYIRLTERRTTDDLLRDLLHRCQSELGVSDFRTREVHLSLLWKLYANGDYGVALEGCYELLCHKHGEKFDAVPRVDTLYLLALCEERSLKFNLAMVHLREAIDIRISRCGSFDNRARGWLVQLQSWLTDDGRAEEVAEVQRWWELMRQAEEASEAQAIPPIGSYWPQTFETPIRD